MYEVFDKVVSEYEKGSIINKEKLYKDMKNNKVDFKKGSNLRIINQHNKRRRVLYSVPNSLEEITLKYLKKRLDYLFNIQYPNRNKIMRSCFGITESLNNLSDFVIYKLDFKNFFESVSSRVIFYKYINNSDILRHERENFKRLINTHDHCYAGIPTSNALIEIIAREFDRKMKASLGKHGLVFYSRYVDDVLIILNRRISRRFLEDNVYEIAKEVFESPNVKVNEEKCRYITKSDTNEAFAYLGYKFIWCDNTFTYGISPDKLKKYEKRLECIVRGFNENEKDLELLRQQLLFFSSRVVFYNNFNSKYSKHGNWDVVGVIANYSELRPFARNNRLTNQTFHFLKNKIIRIVAQELKEVPYFLKRNNDHYQLLERMKRNKSIVFHPNIGWTQKHLQKMIKKISPNEITIKRSYRELVKIYCRLLQV